ncbi:MAG: purine-binding chemotaxis protein CheW [Rhodobacteraceae bacterium]|nr:purine-binding chemotaxis protein CheW [Paracoccaceae bacterium]
MPEAAQKLSADKREIVSFTIHDQAFCIDIGHVLEIRGWTPTTALPHAPDYVNGLMNLRGTVLPVLDMSQRLGLGKAEPSARHVIIIVRPDDMTVGFLVEAVSDILTVSNDEMTPTPDVNSAETKSFVEGIFTHGDQLIRALDVRSIMPAQSDIGTQ